MSDFKRNGFVVFDDDPRVARWATRAHIAACDVTNDPAERARWLRHGETWFVGVDALPNGPDGAVGGVPLAGPWEEYVAPPATWHKAQTSVVYPGYPKRDAQDSEAAHRFRVNRCAAHVDGLHLEKGRRIMREPHGFILGVPLNNSKASPLVIWKGSHEVMRKALASAIKSRNPIGADVTEIYKATRAQIFEHCTPVEIDLRVGQSVLVDRFALHGVAAWRDGDSAPVEGRMVAYFRPLMDPRAWLGP